MKNKYFGKKFIFERHPTFVGIMISFLVGSILMTSVSFLSFPQLANAQSAAPAAPTLSNVWSRYPNMFLQWTLTDYTATSYKIFYGETSGFPGNATEVDITGTYGNDYDITGLRVGTSYSFYVIAHNTGGDSAPSNTVIKTIFTPPTLKFTIPQQEQVIGSSNGIVVNSGGQIWQTVTDGQIVKFDPANPYAGFIKGLYGSSKDELSYPNGIAQDSSGNLYVADSGNNRIVKLDSSGNFILTWGDGVDGTTGGNVCTAASGDVCQTGNPGPTQTGNPGGELSGQIYNPEGVAVDSSQDVYVVETSNSRVEKFDSNGTYLTQWGGVGQGNGNLQFPGGGIAIDNSNNVYVVDNNNNRVEKFDSNGTYLTQWGSLGSGDGEFNFGGAGATGIAVDGSNVYVSDTLNSRVEQFDSNGDFKSTWGWGVSDGHTQGFQFCTSNCFAGIPGYSDGQFVQPFAIAVDPNSESVYVTDIFNRLMKFQTTDGGATFSYATQYGDGGNDAGKFGYLSGNIAFDTSGNSYVVDSSNNRVQIFSNTGAFVTQWNGSDIPTTPGFNSPNTVAVDGSGNIYIADQGNNRIVECSGGISNSATCSGTISTWDGSDSGKVFAYPGGVAIDESGNLYVADTGNNRIVKCTGGIASDVCANTPTIWDGSNSGTAFVVPISVALDGSANVYVLDNNNRIVKFDNNGNFISTWGWGVTDGSSVFQVCTSNCQAGIQGSGDGQMNGPYTVALDPSGNVYVADSNNNRIEEFTNSGTFLKDWGYLGNVDGQMNGASALGVDNSGNIYVGDYRIQVFNSFGASGGSGSCGSGSGPNSQCLSVPINCNINTPAPSFAQIPATVNFIPATAGTQSDITDTDLTGSNSSAAASGAIPEQNLLAVSVGDSGGSASCPVTNAGFVVTAAATDLRSSTGGDIPAGDIHMITTSDVTGASTASGSLPALNDGPIESNTNQDVLYSDTSNSSGDLADVVAPLDVSKTTDLTKASDYDATSDNSFVNNQQLTVLQTCTGHGESVSPNTVDIGVGVGLETDVPPSTPVGNYTSTVTFTYTPIDCGTSTGATLASAVDATTTTINVSSASGLTLNEVVLIDAEKMQITAINGNQLTVTRAYSGTTPSEHAQGTIVYSGT